MSKLAYIGILSALLAVLLPALDWARDLHDEVTKPEMEGDAKVLGGQQVGTRVPYMCSLRSHRTGQHICGAVLIGLQLALTAAECVEPGFGSPKPQLWCGLSLLDGDSTNSNKSQPYDVFETVRMQQHPCWERRSFLYDAALLELNTSTQHSAPIPQIIQQQDMQQLDPGHMLTLLGWGAVQQGSVTPSNALQQAALPLVAQQECSAAYTNAMYNTTTMFCAGYFNVSIDASTGDSGGPIIDSTNERLVGLVSWGAASNPGVYTRVDSVYDWTVGNGFCGCTQTGLSGGVATSEDAHCSAGVWEQGPGFSTSVSVMKEREVQRCYVIDPGRCPYSISSEMYPGAGWIGCSDENRFRTETAC